MPMTRSESAPGTVLTSTGLFVETHSNSYIHRSSDAKAAAELKPDGILFAAVDAPAQSQLARNNGVVRCCGVIGSACDI